jgi:hypothetical protein
MMLVKSKEHFLLNDVEARSTISATSNKKIDFPVPQKDEEGEKPSLRDGFMYFVEASFIF